MEKLKEWFPYLIAFIPILAFATGFYSDHNNLKADVEDLKNKYTKIEEKLDRISEKLNIIDGKISEHMRLSK